MEWKEAWRFTLSVWKHCYVHVPNEKRSKLDDKSEKYIFIGYDSNSKGYKLYNPNSGKTIINQDVIFNEEVEWD